VQARTQFWALPPLQVVWVTGAYEIPVVASAMARSGRFDAVVAIGTVVRAVPYTAHPLSPGAVA
jgi:6,7-dimethyl-8-ribityllumazine synthase